MGENLDEAAGDEFVGEEDLKLRSCEGVPVGLPAVAAETSVSQSGGGLLGADPENPRQGAI